MRQLLTRHNIIFPSERHDKWHLAEDQNTRSISVKFWVISSARRNTVAFERVS